MARRFPLPDWLGDYRKSWIGRDLVAGLTAAAVVIPKALAYATVAGLPVRVGLATAMAPMAIYAFLGTSRALSVSTVGFKAGIGVVIMVDQLPKLLGLHIHKGSFVHNVLAIGQDPPHTLMVALLVGAGTVALLVLLERFVPRAPAPLIAVAAGIAGVSLLGVDHLGLATVGTVPTGLPPLTWPRLDLLEQLWPAALGIALMSFTEAVAAGRAFARSKEPAPQPNRELLAIALANAGGAFVGAMPAGGGTTQTAVNREAGARSQMAGLVTAAVALGALLLLAPLVALMPDATLAAVGIVYSIGLIKPAEFSEILKVRSTEFAWALIALAGVILLAEWP